VVSQIKLIVLRDGYLSTIRPYLYFLPPANVLKSGRSFVGTLHIRRSFVATEIRLEILGVSSVIVTVSTNFSRVVASRK
jgi:hypothetical protein